MPSTGLFGNQANNANNDQGGMSKEVQDAFQNLFKGSSNDNMIGGGFLQTPFFNNSKYMNRAEPLGNKLTTETPPYNQRDPIMTRSRDPFVFSPTPNLPTSTYSIFGVHGNNNISYSPFHTRNSLEKHQTPKKSPITTEKILR